MAHRAAGKILALLTGLFAAAGAANAACNAVISDISPIVIVFNPFDGAMAFKEFDVRVVNGGSDACHLALGVKSDAVGSQRELTNGPDRLIYVIKTDGGVQLTNDINAPGGLITLPAGPGTEGAMTLRLEVSAGQIAAAGAFSDTLTMRLYDIDAALAPVGLETTARASGVVPPRAQINLAGSDAAFAAFTLDHLDFGELEPGKARDAVVQVRSTSPVTISVLSQNKGALQHKVLGDTVPKVPYILTLDGQTGDLSAGAFAVNRTPRMTLNGENYPLHIVIGAIQGAVSGDYQDILTVNVVPR